MRISIRDNVKTAHQSRQNYMTTQVEKMLSHFGSTVHQVDVTLNLEGHNEVAETHCHVTASLGSLGVIVADWRDVNGYDAFKGAVGRLARGIGRKISKRQTQRQHSESMSLPTAG